MSRRPSVPPKFWTQPQFPSPLLLTAGIPLQHYSSSPPQQPLSELEHSGTADSHARGPLPCTVAWGTGSGGNQPLASACFNKVAVLGAA